MHMHTRLRATGLAAAAALALAGCAGTPGTTAAPDPAELERVAEQRWEHLIAGEFGQAWEYFSPGYQAIRPKERYAQEMAGRPVHWTSAEFQSRDCAAPDSCKLRMKIGFRVKMAVTGVGEVAAFDSITENWIFLDGRWVYLPPEAVR